MTQRLLRNSARFDLLIGFGPVTREADLPTPGQSVRLGDYEKRQKSAPSRTLSIAVTI
jgi:hypothetical protein